ncbi:MAG TPA: hypothetical protein DEF45_08165 [Rhodopirellula sp.]|nr:hypothetical protein [Rhodopirellula sp.]
MIQIERGPRLTACTSRQAYYAQRFIHWYSGQEFHADDDSLSDKHPMHYDLSALRVRHKTIFNEPDE